MPMLANVLLRTQGKNQLLAAAAIPSQLTIARGSPSIYFATAEVA